MKIERGLGLQGYADLCELTKLVRPNAAKLGYGLVRNRTKLRTEHEIIKELREPPEEITKWREEFAACNEKHAKRDHENKPVVGADGNYVIGNHTGLDADLKVLKEKYKATFDLIAEKEAQLRKMFKEEIDFEPYVIDIQLAMDDKAWLDDKPVWDKTESLMALGIFTDAEAAKV